MKTNTSKIVTLMGGFLVLAILFAQCEPRAEAASVADFYKDKTITFVAASKPGGGTDLIVRTIAPYLKKYTGASSVIVANVDEAGSMLALNRLWNSKPDGLVLTVTIPLNIAVMEANKEAGVQFQGDKFNIISAPASVIGHALMVNAQGSLRSIDDLRRAKGLKSACIYGRAIIAAYFADVLGLDAKITPGLSTSDSRMALLRGEIDFAPEELGGALEQINSGSMRPLAVDISTTMPLLPQAPSITKLASLSSQQKEWLKIFDVTDSGKYIFMGPKVPKEKVEYMRGVLGRIHKDPEFLKDRKRFERFPGSLPWLNGAEAQRTYSSFLNLAKGKEYSQMVEYLSKKYYTVK
ncbi:MAG: hypothetical protein L7F78_16610 [Syntrophales bacterium LBB04]|nr:hypothetical protein [Syntrophales bacterium LBB04]